jgi:hypothetical protein
MRVDRPVYRGLPACRGRSYEEIDQLIKQVYRRKPSLMVYPLLIVFILSPVAMILPKLVAGWLGLDMIWSLLVTGIVFIVPIVLYEWWHHRPAVNKEMEAIIAENAFATNGSPATPPGGS